MRGADTRHCWPRVNTGHRDRAKLGYTVLILVPTLRWFYNLFVWNGVKLISLVYLFILQFVRGGVVVTST